MTEDYSKCLSSKFFLDEYIAIPETINFFMFYFYTPQKLLGVILRKYINLNPVFD